MTSLSSGQSWRACWAPCLIYTGVADSFHPGSPIEHTLGLCFASLVLSPKPSHQWALEMKLMLSGQPANRGHGSRWANAPFILSFRGISLRQKAKRSPEVLRCRCPEHTTCSLAHPLWAFSHSLSHCPTTSLPPGMDQIPISYLYLRLHLRLHFWENPNWGRKSVLGVSSPFICSQGVSVTKCDLHPLTNINFGSISCYL